MHFSFNAELHNSLVVQEIKSRAKKKLRKKNLTVKSVWLRCLTSFFGVAFIAVERNRQSKSGRPLASTSIRPNVRQFEELQTGRSGSTSSQSRARRGGFPDRQDKGSQSHDPGSANQERADYYAKYHQFQYGPLFNCVGSYHPRNCGGGVDVERPRRGGRNRHKWKIAWTTILNRRSSIVGVNPRRTCREGTTDVPVSCVNDVKSAKGSDFVSARFIIVCGSEDERAFIVNTR